MNILPKKRWHVRTKANIERVRRDEAKAAEEEKEKQRRIQLAEQEARTDFLRQRARLCRREDATDKAVVSAQSTSHVNLFQEVEDGKKSWGTNKDHEAEEKAEKEKYEQQIGLLTYLGQGSAETQSEKPWYFKPPGKRGHELDNDETFEIATKSKSFLDPLEDMKRHLGSEHFIKSNDKNKAKKEKTSHNKQHLKHKKEENVTSSGKSLDELRRARLRRERAERFRTEKLLAKLKGDDKPKESEKMVDGHQGYNSQFNPHLARKTRKD